MRREFQVRPGVVRNFEENLRDRAEFYAITAVSPVIAQGAENIIGRSRFEFENGFWQAYNFAVRDGYVPIILANHQSHFDGVSMSEIARRLSDATFSSGFQMPLASSLDNGDQGGKMQAFYQSQERTLRRNTVYPLILARAKDEDKYNEKANLRYAFADLVRYIDEGFGILEFPEGETTGGKIDPKTGLRNGMIPFQKGSIKSLIRAVEHAGRQAIIVPVSIDGGFRILDPDTKIPTRHSVRVGLGFRRKSDVNFHIGLPMKTDEGEIAQLIAARNWTGVNELVGRKIASHLPEDQRGVYA